MSKLTKKPAPSVLAELPPVLTLPQAAEALQIGDRTLRRYIAEGRLTAYRTGPRHLRLKRSEVEALLEPVPTVATIRAGK